MFLELKEDNLANILSENPKALVQFGASWCGQCRLLKPKVKRLGENSDDVSVLYVDAEKFTESRKLATVTNLPTFAIYHNGKLVKDLTTSKEEHLKELYDEITHL